LGEKVLGRDNKAFTAEQVSVTAAAINQNFDNGTANQGFLACPLAANVAEDPANSIIY
jgi:hypothetical protein